MKGPAASLLGKLVIRAVAARSEPELVERLAVAAAPNLGAQVPSGPETEQAPSVAPSEVSLELARHADQPEWAQRAARSRLCCLTDRCSRDRQSVCEAAIPTRAILTKAILRCMTMQTGHSTHRAESTPIAALIPTPGLMSRPGFYQGKAQQTPRVPGGSVRVR